MEISSITLPLDPNDFPELADRLPTPKEGWSFANTKDLTSSRLDTTTGVIRLIIKHRLVKGVTADAVYWLYRNLHKRVKYPPSDATAKDIPLFQLLHPVDHLSMKCTTCNGAKDRIEAGSSLDFIELQMTKCRVAPIPFWNCSDEATGKDKRVGFVKGDPKDDWYLKYLPTRVTNTVLQLSIKGYKAFGSTEGYKISYVSHDFANATDAQGAHIGLNVTTTVRVGLLKPGAPGTNEMIYDISNSSFPLVNGQIRNRLLGNTDVGSTRKIGRGQMLHSIQEWQNLANWLQPVWAANKAKMPA
uniref:Uncharacterized protein n=1 Tax=Tetradesmus obliquus TaxID=3088 RepID=A0A383VEU0_TETOB|eukprot:jgi/Sobl393_1/16229/SZX64037.1